MTGPEHPERLFGILEALDSARQSGTCAVPTLSQTTLLSSVGSICKMEALSSFRHRRTMKRHGLIPRESYIH